MMTKKQMRTLGYKAIVKNNQSHQEAFDELSQTKGVDRKLLADELSKLPSNGKQKDTASLRYIFIACLALIAAYRIFGIVMFGMDALSTQSGIIIILILFGVLIPILGIYGALKGVTQLYRTTGFLLGYNLIRSFTQGQVTWNMEEFIVIGVYGTAVALAFYIPFKLKTPHKRVVAEKFVDGKLTKTVRYVFEDTRVDESGLLDSKF